MATTLRLWLLLLLATCARPEAQGEPRPRRESVSGLFPFPRVGRGGDIAWAYEPPGSLEKRSKGLFQFPRVGRRSGFLLGSPDDMGSILNKREGLIAFPRIGRSEGGTDRGEANADKAGLWFGPRLGRRDKRAMLLPPWGAVLSLKEIPRQDSFTPRLGRDVEDLVALEDAEDLESSNQGAADILVQQH